MKLQESSEYILVRRVEFHRHTTNYGHNIEAKDI